MPLTNSQLKSRLGKPHDKRQIDLTDSEGLIARWFPSGSISFYYRFRWKQQSAAVQLGRYPSLSIKEARAERDKCKLQLSQGEDPRLSKKLDIAAKRDRVTVRDAVTYWFDNHVTINWKRTRGVMEPFESYIFPRIGDFPVEECSTQHWVGAFKSMRHAPVRAGFTLQNAKQALKYCRLAGYCDSRALAEVSKGIVGRGPGVCERYHSHSEIHEVWNYCVDHSSRSSLSTRYCGLVLMVTAARSAELRLALKSDFDLDNMVWTVPKENSKTDMPILRPIPPQLLPFLVELINLYPDHRYLVTTSKEDAPISDTAFCMRYSRMAAQLGHESWGAHTFRHTISTLFGDLGIAPYVAEKMQGHKMAGTMAVYNKSHYLPDQLRAMNVWIEYVSAGPSGWEHESPTGKVVLLKCG